ncbi:nucleoside deaminase [Amnibacterium kyonggiense]|uniref:tRNA(Arg) A34 adenosine deaminase TadA n=1 Tax=Amnibacterium kyonggiense TaxID=595671 RepID=A0A4R7FL15_9MICO|nr:nucleoside deaminase [Amnibacterium kyonggiense]TDS77091.1 tRNA(Arg) A34 adenosine deaminase TadA [Amnibacterium kyonggiense]
MDTEALVRRAIVLADRARAGGNHPFGALLAAPDGTVVLEAGNTVGTTHDVTGHAETNLVSAATRRFSRDELRTLTLVTSCEPCAMCSGAIYWSWIGAVVYGLSEEGLLALTGDDPENPTLALPCRTVLGAGQRDIRVEGPLLEDEAAASHRDFWRS